MAKRTRSEHRWVKPDARLFTLEVSLLSGPITAKFAKKNRIVSRTIQIRGDQTLEDLHDAIFEAFDREDEHMYEFQIGGKRPMDPKAKRYVLPMEPGGPFEDMDSAGTVDASISALGLQKQQSFGYWFDFGDDWWHQVYVLDIEEQAARGKYPKIIKRVGKSPPQYVDFDEEGDQ